MKVKKDEPAAQNLPERRKDSMEQLLGEIELFSYEQVPGGWMSCKGQTLLIEEYRALYQLLGNTFGGDGKSTFCLPDLQKALPMKNVGMQFCIAINGIYPQPI